MLLRRLKEYEDRCANDADLEEEEALPEEYMAQAVPWILSIDLDGGNPSFIRTSGGIGKRDPGKRFLIPYLKRSGTNIKPQLLADKAELVLGIALEDTQRAKKRHSDFAILVEACAHVTHDPRVLAVSRFLQQFTLDTLPVPKELTPNDFITFEVDNVRLVALPSVQDFWARIAPQLGQRAIPALTVDLICSWLNTSDAGIQGQCIVCGEQRTIARVHPVAIKLPRVVSDQQLAIITANKDAFSSYGLEQSFIAPTCRPCAAGYTKGLNRLARDESTHLLLGSSILLFWTQRPVSVGLFNMLTQPKLEEVRKLRDAAQRGERMPDVNATAFYAVMLSASGARVVVRDWIDTTVGAVQDNLERWFSNQLIVDEYGQEAPPLSVFRLADATVRMKSDGKADRDALVPSTSQALLNVALLGTRLPDSLLLRVLRRVRAEQRVTLIHAALLKLVLFNRYEHKENYMVALDPEHSDPGYQCGRLFAVLADIQKEAIGTAVIIERFFGTASSTPQSVFRRLVRGAQPHLSKLARDNEPAYYALDQRLEEILDKLREFPTLLEPKQQGLFVLGFYHQRAADRARMVAHKRAALDKDGETKAN